MKPRGGARKRHQLPRRDALRGAQAAAPPEHVHRPNRHWKVKIVGLVTRRQGNGQVAVPHGEYMMRETELGSYFLSREIGPKFALSEPEVGAAVDEGRLKIVEGSWP